MDGQLALQLADPPPRRAQLRSSELNPGSYRPNVSQIVSVDHGILSDRFGRISDAEFELLRAPASTSS